MMFKVLPGLLLVACVAVFVLIAEFEGSAHSGRTDKDGGHFNRKTGEYHYHGGGSSGSNSAAPAVEAPRTDPWWEDEEQTEDEPSISLLPYPRRDMDWKIQPVRVIDVIDGDTIEVEELGELKTVRLIGVDTPETVHPNKPVEEFGKEASAFTHNLLQGEMVWLQVGEQDTLDKYGRTLAYVWRAPDDLFVNLEIVRQGYGYAYTQFPFQYSDLFTQYQDRAEQCGRGLWANP